MELNKKEKDLIHIAQHVESIMNILGIEMNESTVGTPMRVAKMFKNEMFSSLEGTKALDEKMKLFEAPTGESEMIIVKDIPFYSTCEHHLMPFFGKVAVGYVPNNNIIGLSKIPRVVKHFSKKPQVQERLGEEIKNYLVNVLDPKYLVVKIYDTTHTCCTARGIESEGVTTTMHVYKEHKMIDCSESFVDYSYYMNHFRNEVK